MWKAAAVVAMVTVAGAAAHAQQQQSAIETFEKTMSDLAREGYEIKAAEDLSGDMPKFVLQKAESIVICQITEGPSFSPSSRAGPSVIGQPRSGPHPAPERPAVPAGRW
jgi:hypothetical protein